MDVYRTAAGNRIDGRLALGIARTFLNRISLDADKALERADKRLSARSFADRKDALIRLRRAAGPLYIGMAASKNLREAVLARYEPFSLEEGRPVDSVGVMVDQIDLAAPGSRGPFHATYWPYHSPKFAAIIQIHAIARLVQRSGVSDPNEILKVLKTVSAWSSIATHDGDAGSWMLPMENGLVCAQNVTLKSADPEIGGLNVPLIKTFIDCGSFRHQNAGAWERLVANGILETRPKFPSREAPEAEHLRLWALMRDEGRGWDLRHAHALRMRAEAEDGDGSEDLDIDREDMDDMEAPYP
jgi:hypothetical protein